jgi:hypothetical protein
MIYMLGPTPEHDDAFLQVVELAGKRIEEIKRRAKARNFGEAKPRNILQKQRKLLTKIKTIEKKGKRKKLLKTIKEKKKIKNLKRKNLPQQNRA